MKLKDHRKRKGGILPVVLAFLILMLFAASALFLKTAVPAHKQQSDSTPRNSIKNTLSAPKYSGHDLHIDIKKEAYRRLRNKADEAVERGLLFTSKEDLVDANVQIDGKDYACKLRLKGDLMDHLKGHKWSFRIMLKGDEWQGMSTFSIHNSKSRAHTAEWIMHALFREEGIIVPDYDFLRVKLNGQDLGAYAYEHHFENQMLKKNGRDLGPILKHTDDAYWENVQAKLNPFPWIEASHIELFNKKNKSDPQFIKAFEVGRSRLNDFLEGRKTVEDVFDLHLMAKYYALLDVSHAWHAQQFTNIRFYFNPLSGKLEPIAYDCFGDYLHDVTKDWEAFGEAMNDRVDKDKNYAAGNVYRHLLFKDENFSKVYMTHLARYTAPKFLKDMKERYDSALNDRNRIIQSDGEYANYTLNWDKFLAKAEFTYKKLQPRPALSLKAFRNEGSKTTVTAQSYHGFSLEVLGYGDEASMLDTLPVPVVLEPYNKRVPVRQYEITNSRPIEYLYFRTLGLNEIHKTRLINVNASQRTTLEGGNDLAAATDLAFVKNVNGSLVISNGQHSIDRPLVIPRETSLQISPGTTLTFEGAGSLLCYGRITAVGTTQNPIKFISSSVTSGSIMISGSQSRNSNLEHCHFFGLGAYDHGNISSSAAVTLYDTEVQMNHCKFMNIKAQEAIRIELSKTEMSNLDFTNIQGSAIRCGNSAAKISKVSMANIGRDGLVVKSGSLEGFGYKMYNVLNQAMAFSENADIYISNAGVTKSHQAFHASGHAKVIIKSLSLSKVKRGVEVRGSVDPVTEVVLGKVNHEGVDNLYLIKPGVVLSVDGKVMRPE